MTDARAAEAALVATPVADASPSEAPVPLPWPCEVPAQQDAEAAVAAALGAHVVDAGALVTRVSRELTEIESSAFDGISLADPALLKAAAGLRLRLATALATAPAHGAVDAEAAQQLLATADDVLARLARESDQANAMVAGAIGAIRTDLIRDAIRVSEAHQRLANPAAAPAPVAPNAPAQVRLLSNDSADAQPVAEQRRRNVAMWAVLVVAVLAAGGYHLDRMFTVNRAKARIVRLDGAPERASGTTRIGDGQLLFTPPGAPLTPAELQQLRAAQAARGRKVVERAPGVYAVEKLTDGR